MCVCLCPVDACLVPKCTANTPMMASRVCGTNTNPVVTFAPRPLPTTPINRTDGIANRILLTNDGRKVGDYPRSLLVRKRFDFANFLHSRFSASLRSPLCCAIFFSFTCTTRIRFCAEIYIISSKAVVKWTVTYARCS